MNRNSNDLNKQSISLEQYGILNAKINYNFSVEKLYRICVENKLGVLTNNNVTWAKPNSSIDITKKVIKAMK